jgi:hypothetical protein
MPLLRYDDQKHAYFDTYGRVASVTQVLSASGVGGYDIYRMMQATAPEKLRAAADRGSKVHTATELYDNGLLDWDALDETIVPYVQAYISWLDWTRFEPLSVERMVYHERFRYAGRLDRIGRIGEDKWVVDIKSGLLLEGHSYQTAAYCAALPEPLSHKRMLVQLCNDGKFVIHTPPAELYYTHLQIFLAALDETRDEIEGHYESIA